MACFGMFATPPASYGQRFRKGVGGQRGLAQGNPSHAIDSGLLSALFILSPLNMSRRTPHFVGHPKPQKLAEMKF